LSRKEGISILNIQINPLQQLFCKKRMFSVPYFFVVVSEWLNLKISDHQQNVAPFPSRDLHHIPSTADGR